MCKVYGTNSLNELYISREFPFPPNFWQSWGAVGECKPKNPLWWVWIFSGNHTLLKNEKLLVTWYFCRVYFAVKFIKAVSVYQYRPASPNTCVLNGVTNFKVSLHRSSFNFFLLSVDMVSGFNVATVNHDSRIDWLEVNMTLLL